MTVNATCGEGVPVREVYCKLVGYDRLESTLSKYDILDGQVNRFKKRINFQCENYNLIVALDLRLLLSIECQ